MSKYTIAKPFENMGEVWKLRDEVIGRLTEEQLLNDNAVEFCHQILSFFDFENGSIDKDDVGQVEAACSKVLVSMGLNQNIMFEELGLKGETVSPIDEFLEYFLGFKILPGKVVNRLNAQVIGDLAKIDALIANYQSHDFIKNGDTPRNHRERTIKVFYDRCVEEKGKIQGYLDTGMRERAFIKARGENTFGMSMMFLDSFYDRPYRLSYPYSREFFNNVEIDAVTHRLSGLPIKKSQSFIGLYKTNKRQFYEELEGTIPISQLIQLLFNYANYLPCIQPQRKEIFVELKDTFENGKWFSFYALGLTQIEGLFGDMCRMCDPNFTQPKAALPDKVGFIRSFYKQIESKLDYFQFQIPNQRNSFLHYGVELNGEIDLLCKDVLFDLVGCLKIFAQLDTPENWLNILIKKADVTEFYSESSFCFYFSLVRKVIVNKHYLQFQGQIENLNQNFFPDIVQSLTFDLNDRFNEVSARVNSIIVNNFTKAGFTVNMDITTPKEIADNREWIASVTSNDFSSDEFISDLQTLLAMKVFLSQYSNILDRSKLHKDSLDVLTIFERNHLSYLKKVSQLHHIKRFDIHPYTF